MTRRIICIILSAVLLISALPLYSLADCEDTIRGTVRYCAGHNDNTHDYETGFTYSDSYFSRSSYEYRFDLIKSSFALALAAFSSMDAKIYQQDVNFVSFAEQCGFGNISTNKWYTSYGDFDSIGVACASKKLSRGGEDCTLIAVGVRGNNYGTEWSGNFKLGDSGEHEGFALCREQILCFLKAYIAEAGIEGRVKLWMSGYSRGGAAANMAAAKLDLGYVLSEKISLAPDDIYCCTFEAPKGAIKEEADNAVFDNIRNIVNSNDPVTYCGFSQWGFVRYGIDYFLPDSCSDGYEAMKSEMLKVFDTMENNGGAYSLDDFKYVGTARCADGSEITQREFYAMLTDALCTDCVSSRQEYASEVQDGLGTAIAYLMVTEDLDLNAALSEFSAALKSGSRSIIAAAMSFNAVKKVALLLEEALMGNVRYYGYTPVTSQELNEGLLVLARLLVRLTAAHPDYTATVLANAETLIKPHYVEYTISWLNTMPEDFLEGSTDCLRAKSLAERSVFNSVFALSDSITALFEKVFDGVWLIRI